MAAASSSGVGGAPAYALYRASGLGKAFVESIGEMFNEHELTHDQVIQALLIFDKVRQRREARSSLGSPSTECTDGTQTRARGLVDAYELLTQRLRVWRCVSCGAEFLSSFGGEVAGE
jgi:hypothetical protein